jgi:deoxyxylulose-5-phosphate synthase
VITTKGKGLKQAEEDQVKYHAPGKFDAKSGEIHKKQENLQNIKMFWFNAIGSSAKKTK